MKKLILVLPFIFGMVCIGHSQTVKIGTQVWATKNLNVDKFRNGDPIPEAKTTTEWKEFGANKMPAWCYYDNNPANGAKYGKLYNWYAVTDERGLAPDGFHIPTKEEWDILIERDSSNFKMKSTTGWKSYAKEKTCPGCASWSYDYRAKVACHTCKDTRVVPDRVVSGNGSNKLGFSGLPGGYINSYGTVVFGRWVLIGSEFLDLGTHGYWWCSNNEIVVVKLYNWLHLGRTAEYSHSVRDLSSGFSVRCIQNSGGLQKSPR